jgi:hypothetical protein
VGLIGHSNVVMFICFQRKIMEKEKEKDVALERQQETMASAHAGEKQRIMSEMEVEVENAKVAATAKATAAAAERANAALQIRASDTSVCPSTPLFSSCFRIVPTLFSKSDCCCLWNSYLVAVNSCF